MEVSKPFVISISRLFGSGGAYVGQQLAANLNMLYVDREIISEAAKALSVGEEDVELHDEKVTSVWQSYFQSLGFFAPDTYAPPILVPSDQELHEVEAKVIESIADTQSAIIIGRCGAHVLRDHANHISVFLHSHVDVRIARVMKIYNLPEGAATERIRRSDRERTRYFHMITGNHRTDALQYDLSIDTGKLGLDESVQLITRYVELARKH